MKPYRIRAEARRELRNAAGWYEAQEPGLGIDLLTKFEEKLDFALQAAGAGKLEATTASGAEIRSFRLDRFDRYAIVMATIAGVPTVLAFMHTSRRPQDWRRRAGG